MVNVYAEMHRVHSMRLSFPMFCTQQVYTPVAKSAQVVGAHSVKCTWHRALSTAWVDDKKAAARERWGRPSALPATDHHHNYSFDHHRGGSDGHTEL